MNAILFAKDGTTRTIVNVQPSTYMDVPVYVSPGAFTQWQADGYLPHTLTNVHNKVRYAKQMESQDYAVFVEE